MNRAPANTKNIAAPLDRGHQTSGTHSADALRTSASLEWAIPGCLAAAAQRYRNRQALAGPFNVSLSYVQLFDQVTRAVETLNNLGIGRGDGLRVLDGCRQLVGEDQRVKGDEP